MMDKRKVYWFALPADPKQIGIAVQPFMDNRDGRLKFQVTGSGCWQLTGKLLEDSDEKIVFQCNDEVMGARGGTYTLNLLTIKEFRGKLKRHVSDGDTIAQVCSDTNDLHFWFRRNWPNTELPDFERWQMEENRRKGLRTDTWNMDSWTEKEKQRYEREQGKKKD